MTEIGNVFRSETSNIKELDNWHDEFCRRNAGINWPGAGRYWYVIGPVALLVTLHAPTGKINEVGVAGTLFLGRGPGGQGGYFRDRGKWVDSIQWYPQ